MSTYFTVPKVIFICLCSCHWKIFLIFLQVYPPLSWIDVSTEWIAKVNTVRLGLRLYFTLYLLLLSVSHSCIPFFAFPSLHGYFLVFFCDSFLLFWVLPPCNCDSGSSGLITYNRALLSLFTSLSFISLIHLLSSHILLLFCWRSCFYITEDSEN